MQRSPWQDWTSVLLGFWIAVSPLVFSHLMIVQNAATPAVVGRDAMWNFYLVGAAAVTLGSVRLLGSNDWEKWPNFVLGGWLLVSPWALGFAAATALTWNAVLVGALLSALAFWAMVPVQTPNRRCARFPERRCEAMRPPLYARTEPKRVVRARVSMQSHG